MTRASASETMLLTGCASGIGRHLASVLARLGHRLVATDVNEAALADTANAEGWDAARVVQRAFDVRNAAAWEEALDVVETNFGPVDVLMNIAGYLKPGYVHEAFLHDIDLHMDVNVKGPMFGTRAAAKRMIARRRGHIVNVGSLAAIAPIPGLCLYSASTFAVRGFSLAAAQELAPHGVAVTVVLLDAVQTPMLDLQVDFAEASLAFSGVRPLTVDEVARSIVDDVLPRRPLELLLPPARGLMAKIAGATPTISRVLAPVLRRVGRRAQERIKASRP